MSSIEQKDHGFVMIEDGREVGEVTYVAKEEGVLLLDHTFVAESMRGQKAGEQLVDRVVELARSTGAKIDPVCPFANALFKRNPEYGDVWLKD